MIPDPRDATPPGRPRPTTTYPGPIPELVAACIANLNADTGEHDDYAHAYLYAKLKLLVPQPAALACEVFLARRDQRARAAEDARRARLAAAS